MLKILLSNDDGVLAPGLIILKERLEDFAHVTVMAPESDSSGASSSLTLSNPIRVRQLAENYFAVRGTPADCVHAALSGFLSFTPDIVISGINNRSNLGEDVFYSGTFAAAFEGRHLKYPALSLSMASTNQLPQYGSGVEITVRLINDLINQEYMHPGVLNVNIPDLPLEQIKGISLTKVGRRLPSQAIEHGVDPRGSQYFWLGSRGLPLTPIPDDSDFAAIRDAKVSVSPISLDLTDMQHFNRMQNLFS
jgi:5'-nucleotidase